MASTCCSAFSPDGKYLAYCGGDGKLKIWDTATSLLKQEYVPNLHLSSPCSVLAWIPVSRQSNSNSTSPWKKRRRKSTTEEGEETGIVALGSVNGNVILWDTATASVSKQLQNGHTGVITAITWSDSNGLFTSAEDKQIVEWNVRENGIKSKWKSGKHKITALTVLTNQNSLISASKIIKWWDLATKRLITSFTGHASEISLLNPITMKDDINYLISGANGDRQLNVWALNKDNTDKNSVAILAMPDDPVSVSTHINEESQIEILAVTRSGTAHLFQHQPNGRSSKPLKPVLAVVIASSRGQKESSSQISILSGKIWEDSRLLLAYGSPLGIMFEKVVPDFSEKLQCLVRSERKKSAKQDREFSKLKATEVDGDVEYLVAGTPTTVKRNRGSAAGLQLPMEIRLENLSLKTSTNTPGETPTKATNMAQLLMQGLQSKDKVILREVLMRRDETLIKNTVAGMPVQTIVPLLKELTAMLQGKLYVSKITITWLKILVQTFAGHLLSYPDIGDLLGPILGTVDEKVNLLPQLCRLKGRLALVTGQISQASQKQDKLNEPSLLVYQEPDSSDDDSEVEELPSGSESDEIWEEASDEDMNQDADIANDQNDDDNISMSD